MSYSTYDDFVTDLAARLVVPATDPRFETLLPAIISYAELRIQREPELDFLANRGPADTTGRTTARHRAVPFPPAIVVCEKVNLILPANQGTASAGTRVPLLRTTRAFIENIWPTAEEARPPEPWQTYYAVLSQWSDQNNNIIIAPTPDDTYTVEIYGTHRPTPLSAANQTTFLTTYYYDLFAAAAMVFAAGAVLKNFGSAGMVDDGQMSLSWEQTYQSLLRGVAVESMRQKYFSSGWSSFPPAPLAAFPRGDRPAPPAPSVPPGPVQMAS